MIRIVTLVLVLGASLAGCVAVNDPQTQQRAAGGAVLGAAIGAGVGVLGPILYQGAYEQGRRDAMSGR